MLTLSPKIPELEPFLATLMLKNPPSATEYSSEIIALSIPAIGTDKSGQPINEISPTLKIWYKNTDGFTINSLISLVESTLRRKGHLSTRRIALAVIGLYVVLRQPDNSSASFLFEILENTITASANLFYIFPKSIYLGKESRISPFQFGSYSFGELDMAQIKQLCKKAKSDYYERYETHLRRRFTIQSQFPEVIVLNWWSYREQRSITFSLISSLAELFNELIENYFDQLNHALFERFFEGIGEEQYLTIPIGDTYIDEKSLENLPLADRVVIFQNIDGKHENGFVKPLGSGGYILDFAAVDTLVPKALGHLQSEFNLIHLENYPIHQTIKTFARFVSKAKKYRWEDYLDDALLHFIIALDIVFGEENQSTDSVSRRVAVLTYQKARLSYKEQAKRIRALYRERSKYVHEGKSISKVSVDEAEEICKEALFCLLRIQKDEQRRTKIAMNNLLKDIDLISATLEADRVPDNSLLIELGISSDM